MGNFANNALTNSGMALLADVHSGAVLIPTKIVIGSGEMPANKTPATMTDVVAPVKNLSVTKKKRSADGKCIFGGVYNNEDVTSAFYFRELALYCRAEYRDEAGNVTQSVPECLYSYGNSGDTADYMPAYSTGTLVEKQIDLVVWVGNEAEVDLSVASGLYVARDGDTMTGDLTVEKALPALILQAVATYATRLFKNANASNDFGTVLRDTNGDKSIDLMLSALTDTFSLKVNGAEYPVFTAKNPPNPSQVGAVAKIGDTMTGQLMFDTPGLFSAIAKKRTIDGINYMMRVGVGNYGTGGTVSLRLATVAADGTETITGQFDLDNTGVYWTPNGGTRRTIAHSGNLGVLTASVG